MLALLTTTVPAIVAATASVINVTVSRRNDRNIKQVKLQTNGQLDQYRRRILFLEQENEELKQRIKDMVP